MPSPVLEVHCVAVAQDCHRVIQGAVTAVVDGDEEQVCRIKWAELQEQMQIYT